MTTTTRTAKTTPTDTFMLNGHAVRLTLGELESNSDGGHWRNATCKLATGQTIRCGGGWVHSDASATEANNRNGVNLSAAPYWPNATYEGDLDPYEGWDQGDFKALMEAVGLDPEDADARRETWDQVERASAQAYRNSRED